MDKVKETNISSLRNKLTPLYSLAQIIVGSGEKGMLKDEEVLRILVDSAKQALKNQGEIKRLLTAIEKEIENGK